jgi:hypothetical protein
MDVKSAEGVASQEWYGSSNSDNNRPTAATPLSFWELKPVPNNDQYNYSFKFNGDVDTRNCDVNVYFAPDKNYTHEVIIK